MMQQHAVLRQPDGLLEGRRTRAFVICHYCASSATELVDRDNPVLTGARIYQCKQCGYVDFAEEVSAMRT